MKAKLAIAMAAATIAASALAQPGARGPGGDFEQYRAQMWARMQQMHEQMDRIRDTTDPQERDKLLREHYETMQQGMGAMQGYGPGMMGPGGGRGMMGPGGGGMGGRGFGRGPYASGECGKLADPRERRECMLDERLDIMEGMMDQMVEREGYRYGPRRR